MSRTRWGFEGWSQVLLASKSRGHPQGQVRNASEVLCWTWEKASPAWDILACEVSKNEKTCARSWGRGFAASPKTLPVLPLCDLSVGTKRIWHHIC